MAFSQWWGFRAGMVDSDRDQGGVYEFADASGNIVYIGSTSAIKRRLLEHLGEDAKSCIRTNAIQYRIDYRSDYAAEELRLYEAFERQNGKPPKCNDKRPPG